MQLKDQGYSKHAIAVLEKALVKKGYQIEENKNAARFVVSAMDIALGDSWIYPWFAHSQLLVRMTDREKKTGAGKVYNYTVIPVLSGSNRAIKNFSRYIPQCPATPIAVAACKVRYEGDFGFNPIRQSRYRVGRRLGSIQLINIIRHSALAIRSSAQYCRRHEIARYSIYWCSFDGPDHPRPRSI